MEFVYWGIKGIGEPIRYLLSYLKLEYTETNLESRKYWDEQKVILLENGFDFPNLPYIKDGKRYIPESKAIPLYLVQKAKREDLFGKTMNEQIKHQMLLEYIEFIRRNTFRIIKTENTKEVFTKQRKRFYLPRLTYLSDFLKEKKYFMGYLTYSDFTFLYSAQVIGDISKTLEVENPVFSFPNLKNHEKTMNNLEGLKDYIENDFRTVRNYIPKKLSKIDFK